MSIEPIDRTEILESKSPHSLLAKLDLEGDVYINATRLCRMLMTYYIGTHDTKIALSQNFLEQVLFDLEAKRDHPFNGDFELLYKICYVAHTDLFPSLVETIENQIDIPPFGEHKWQ